MFSGALYALAACFLWGMIFIIPTFMQEFHPFEIALGRHFVYGLLSLCFLTASAGRFRTYPFKIWSKAFMFSFIANILFYSCVVAGVNYASPSLTALILGLSPIAISLYGNLLENECRFKDLLIPSALIFTGLILVNIPALQSELSDEKPHYLLGAIAALGSLTAWSWYVVTNARFLKKHPFVAASDWSTMMGSATFCWVIVLGTIYESVQGQEHWQQFIAPSAALQTYFIGCLILGIVCSWIGAFLWNNASTRLPVALAGQISIFETIFGLLFFYILQQSLPPVLEGAGIFLMLAAVFYSMSNTFFVRSSVAID